MLRAEPPYRQQRIMNRNRMAASRRPYLGRNAELAMDISPKASFGGLTQL